MHTSVFVPQQTYGVDCGVFTCMTANFLADDLPLLYNQSHMALFRKNMVYDIANCMLLYDDLNNNIDTTYSSTINAQEELYIDLSIGGFIEKYGADFDLDETVNNKITDQLSYFY